MYFILFTFILTFVQAKYVFTEKDYESMQIIPSNEIIRIELKTNPSTGYSWKLRELDPDHFVLVEHGIQPPERIQPGSSYTEFWDIETLDKGFTFIYLFYNSNNCGPIDHDYIIAFQII